MGFLDPFGDGVSIMSGGLSRPSNHRRHSSKSTGGAWVRKRSKSRSKSRSRSRDRHGHGHGHRSRSFVGSFLGVGGGDSHYNKHNQSRGSFFGLGDNHSRSSFFGLSRSSYYKRSPRSGFMHRTLKKVKRLFRDLVHYAKRHPWKVFILAIMPLITGGALTALLARFGLRMPPGLERMIGVASRAASGDHLGLFGDAAKMAGEFRGFGGFGGMGGGAASRGRDRGMGMGMGRGMGGGTYSSWGGLAKMFD